MKKKILVIDDSRFFCAQIVKTLTEAGYYALSASSAEQGLIMLNKEMPDLLLLDIIMPDMDGFELCKILRESRQHRFIPVIMLTSRDSQEDRLNGLGLGADDYITKPFNERELISRINNMFRRIDVDRSVNPLTGLSGNIIIEREISERIKNNEPFAVIYSDLDNFKSYNDVYGFAKGDMMIKMTADILKSALEECGNADDFIGHVGGDDMVLISTPDKAEDICKHAIELFDTHIKMLFTRKDLEQGYIASLNRKGEKEIFPITTITMAVATNRMRQFASHVEVASIAAEIKMFLKSLSGSNYLIDRRVNQEMNKEISGE